MVVIGQSDALSTDVESEGIELSNIGSSNSTPTSAPSPDHWESLGNSLDPARKHVAAEGDDRRNPTDSDEL